MPTRIYFPGVGVLSLGLALFLLIFSVVTGMWKHFWPLVTMSSLMTVVVYLFAGYRITAHATGVTITRIYGSCLADLQFSQFDQVEITSDLRTRHSLSRFLKNGAPVRSIPVSGRTFALRLSDVLTKANVTHELEDIGASWLLRIPTPH